MKTKCIIILSTKSSGSTACQNILSKSISANHVKFTRHYEFETLYWTKAASILGLHQDKMLDSEVPIRQKKARKDLIKLLKGNIEDFVIPEDDNELIYSGWKRLCEINSPIFLEKSPHHLYQWSAVNLIDKCIKKYPEIDFRLIGLVRNPMDNIYSAWKRWRIFPEKFQYEWYQTYQNLNKCKELWGDKIHIITYESMVSDKNAVNALVNFIGESDNFKINFKLHKNSIAKWKKDKLFGFELDKKVLDLADTFGYKLDDLVNSKKNLWPVHKYITRRIYRLKRPVLNIAIKSKKKLEKIFINKNNII